MERFVAPITHLWFHQNSIISTPDNGILYCSRYDVSYIAPFDSNCLPKTCIINTQGLVAALACSPDWSDQRLFATLDERRLLTVWDLDLQQPIKGHHAHVTTATKVKTTKKQYSNVDSALCFTKDGKLLSCVHSDLVVYCLLTDSYKMMSDFFRNKTVVTLEPSPVDRDVFMAGLKNGLIQIFSIKKMAVLHSLRGHDKEIVSIACMSVPVLKKTVWRRETKALGGTEGGTGSATKSAATNRPKKQARKKAATVAEEPDCFDIYDFNESLEEFGTIVDRESLDDKRDQFREKAKTVEGFNFLEACENLKEDILKAANRRDEEEEEDEAGEQSAIAGEEFNTDDENELDDCEKLRDYVAVGNEDREANVETDEEHDEVDYKLILVSGSRENTVWFWDYETGLPIDKVVVPAVSTAKLCETSFTNAVWIDESHIVANNSNGQVIEWKVEFKYKNDRLHLLAKESLAPYPVEKIFHVIRARGLTKTETNGRYLWCSSINRKLICLEVTESGKASTVLDYSGITSSNRCVVENPLESMVIAISSSSRIEKINLTCLQSDSIPFKSFTHKINSTVMQLCWHPEEEEKLAFATHEGRIGILDTGHSNNMPVILKPFTNKDIYGLEWCYLTDAKQVKRLVLLACSNSEIVYYPLTGAEKYEPIKCPQFGQVSEVAAVNNLCFVGTQDGTLYVSDLDQNFKQLYCGKLAKRYISSLMFKNNSLAVGCNDHTIRLINCSNGFNDEAVKESILLEGHTDGICKLRWNRGDDTMRLVSCSFDCTIRVWDAPSATCLKIYYTKSFAYGAIFSPLDENIIIYVGKGTTLSCFDYTKHHDQPPKATKQPKIVLAVEDSAKPMDSKQKKKKAAREIKNAKKAAAGNGVDNAIEQLTDEVKKVTLQEANAVPATGHLTTTFQLTNRETNKTKDVLECIVKLVHTPDPEPQREPIDYYNDGISSDQDFFGNEFDCLAKPEPVDVKQPEIEPAAPNTEQEKMFYNQKLFSTPEHLKQLIAEEANLHPITDTSSIGLVMLPQMLHKLKETILVCMSKKKLTPQMLALAPYVSHMFWRQCCQAYAYQLIESQQSLAAVPFFLASHKVDASIEELCDAKYYREAWVICRLNKMPDDPILEQVATKWAQHLNGIGNYEAAALVWTGIKKYKEAIDVLTKRRDITEDIQRTIDELNAKLQQVATVQKD